MQIRPPAAPRGVRREPNVPRGFISLNHPINCAKSRLARGRRPQGKSIDGQIQPRQPVRRGQQYPEFNELIITPPPFFLSIPTAKCRPFATRTLISHLCDALIIADFSASVNQPRVYFFENIKKIHSLEHRRVCVKGSRPGDDKNYPTAPKTP